MDSKEGLGGGGFVVLGVGAGGGEVNGSGVDFGVVKSLLGEILGDVMGESGGEEFGVDGRAIWHCTDIKEMDKIKAKTDKAEHEKERVLKSREVF
ncbi:hypothetical protein Tco_0670078 [Tanacetum coccineum]